MIEAQVNTGYMVAIFLTMTVASFSVGFTLGGYNESSFVVNSLKGWQDSTTTLINATGVFGMMIGALFCDKVVPYGRLRAALAANTIIIIGVIPQMFLTVGTLIIGRFLLGLGSGMFTVIASVYMAETVPSSVLGIYGTAVNFGIVFGLLATSVLQGETLPAVDQVTESSTNALRLNFAAPGIFAALNIAMFVFMLKKDSLFFLMESKNEADSLFQFQRIYQWPSYEGMLSQWEVLKIERSLIKKPDSPGLKAIFTDRRFKLCTVFLILSSIINQMSGINAINIYSAEILKEIPQVPTTVGVYMLSGANVVGAMLGPVINRCISIKSLIIGGQFVMSVFLGTIVVFQLTGFPVMVLVSMICFLVVYQSTIGSYYFVYVSQVAIEQQASVAVFTLWTFVLIFSLVTSTLISTLGIAGTFAMFASVTFLGGIFFVKLMKSTLGVSSAECKELYYPEDLKTKVRSDVEEGENLTNILIGKIGMLNNSEIGTPATTTDYSP